jgi:hypothetical protein
VCVLTRHVFQVTNVKAFARQMAAATEGSPQPQQQQLQHLQQQQQYQQQQHHQYQQQQQQPQYQQQQQPQYQQQQQPQYQQQLPPQLFPPTQPIVTGAGGSDAREIARQREKMMLKQQVACDMCCVSCDV